MATLEILALIFSVTLIYLHFVSMVKFKGKKRPPGPPAIPFLGHLLLVGWKGSKMSIQDVYKEMAKKYGPVFYLELGVVKTLVLDDFDIITSVLASEDWTDRFNLSYINDMRSFGKSLGLLFGSGPEHKEIRRFTTRTLRNYGFGKKSCMEIGIGEEVADLMAHLAEKLETEGPHITFKQFFNVSVLNIVWRLMTGVRLSRRDPKLIKLLHMLDLFLMNNPVAFNFGASVPFLSFLAPGRKESLEFEKNLKIFCLELISDRREEGSFMEEQKDFVDMFLHKIETMKYSSDPSRAYYTDEQLIVVLNDFITAGSETSSNAAEFGMLCMVMHPKVQERVQEEIDTVVGRNRPPIISDLADMPYTEATLLEMSRLGSMIPVNGRTAIRDTEVNGYFVPKGVSAMINQYSTHFNEKRWPEPTKFKPERFLNNDGKVVNANQIIPFGFGKRVCPGEAVAKATIFGIITTLLQSYTFEPRQGDNLQNIWLKFHQGFTQSTLPFTVKVNKRS